MSKPIVIYHDRCSDGFTSAWAAWKKFGDNAHYVPMQYGWQLPELDYNTDIYILDFSFPLQKMQELEAVAKSVVLLDHHKSAVENLAGSKYLQLVRMDQSGARLAWEYFHGTENIPNLVLYVEDHDLWRHKLEGWAEVGAVMEIEGFGTPSDFGKWERLAERMQNDLTGMIEKGKFIIEYKQAKIASKAADAYEVEIAGVRVPCVNSTNWQSEIGNVLSVGKPFAAVFFVDNEGNYVYSLRSDAKTDIAMDVSAIAAQFGGGGHKNASGFKTSTWIKSVK